MPHPGASAEDLHLALSIVTDLVCRTQLVTILRMQACLLFPSSRRLRFSELKKKNAFTYLATHKHSVPDLCTSQQHVGPLPLLCMPLSSVCGRKVVTHPYRQGLCLPMWGCTLLVFAGIGVWGWGDGRH